MSIYYMYVYTVYIYMDMNMYVCMCMYMYNYVCTYIYIIICVNNMYMYNMYVHRMYMCNMYMYNGIHVIENAWTNGLADSIANQRLRVKSTSLDRWLQCWQCIRLGVACRQVIFFHSTSIGKITIVVTIRIITYNNKYDNISKYEYAFLQWWYRTTMNNYHLVI